MTRIAPWATVLLVAALGASHAAANVPAVAPEPPRAAVAAPESGTRPASPTALACFGGLDDGEAIVGAGDTAGRFAGTTARACRANGGRALRALRSPAIAVGRPIVG